MLIFGGSGAIVHDLLEQSGESEVTVQTTGTDTSGKVPDDREEVAKVISRAVSETH